MCGQRHCALYSSNTRQKSIGATSSIMKIQLIAFSYLELNWSNEHIILTYKKAKGHY